MGLHMLLHVVVVLDNYTMDVPIQGDIVIHAHCRKWQMSRAPRFRAPRPLGK